MNGRATITQTEARRLKRRVAELERILQQERRRFAGEYIGGQIIASTRYASSTEFLPAVVNTARKLGHAVVCTVDDSLVRYHALPHPAVTP